MTRLEVVEGGPEFARVRVGDTIRYDGRLDGGMSEATVTAIHEMGTTTSGRTPPYIIEAVTTENSLKPGQHVTLTPERMNGVNVVASGGTLAHLSDRVERPRPIAIAADEGFAVDVPEKPPKFKRVGPGVYDSEDGRITMYRIEGVRPPAWNVEWTTDYTYEVTGTGLTTGFGDSIYANIVDGAASMKDAREMFEREWPSLRPHIATWERGFAKGDPGSGEIVRADSLQVGDVFRRSAREARWRVVSPPVETNDGRGMIKLNAVYVSRPKMEPVMHELPREGMLAGVERAGAVKGDPGVANDDPASLSREEFNAINPSYDWGDRVEIARRFDALPDDAEVWLYHATSWKDTALAMAAEGIDVSNKGTNLARERYERGEFALFQPGAGAGRGLYVGFDPRAVEGYGRWIVAVKVRKGDVQVTPEQHGATPGDALSVNDAMVVAPIPPENVRLIGDAARGVPVAEQRIPKHPHEEFVRARRMVRERLGDVMGEAVSVSVPPTARAVIEETITALRDHPAVLDEDGVMRMDVPRGERLAEALLASDDRIARRLGVKVARACAALQPSAVEAPTVEEGAGLWWGTPGPAHLLEALGVPEDDAPIVLAQLLALPREERVLFVEEWLDQQGEADLASILG
jgi:hypothetical protein